MSAKSATSTTVATVTGATLPPRAQVVPPEQLAALRAVGAYGPQAIPPAVLRAFAAQGAFAHTDLNGPPPAPPTDPAVAGELARQLDAARAAARRLMQLPSLERAGYYLGSYYVPGVGVHYIDWRRVGAAFDPARPAMLLVDATPGHSIRLAGFSYWVRSKTEPAGFAGETDQWHRHFGLCFVHGILDHEDVARASQCNGTWVDGSDLWMLHAWVVPGFENTAGVFAARNLMLCGARRGLETSLC